MGAILDALVDGYGPDFPGIEELLAINATDEDVKKLVAPTADMGRYLKSVKFLEGVTSGLVIGQKRFEVIGERFIALTELLDEYDGKYSHKKIAHGLTDKDKTTIRSFGQTVDEIIQAEHIEKFSDHDTAAAVDLIKIKIATELPHLEDMIEGVHYPDTSEDVMSIVFGMICNDLVYGHFVPSLLDFCESMVAYVKKHEKTGPLVLPGLTHQQAAEPTTLGNKFATRLKAIDYLTQKMINKDGNFTPFSGKLGGALGNLTTHYSAYSDINWHGFAEKFVEGFGLHYEEMTDQSVSFVVEAQSFITVYNILSQVIKLTEDFIRMSSSPAQLFVKKKKKGQKGSSIMPNKSNAWGMEGGLKMLKESQVLLLHYATELPNYPYEGDMGRSSMMRNVGGVFKSAFIAMKRISNEMHNYNPNPKKIDGFFREYPGMAGSCLQTVLKRERIEGDAYRAIQDISINDDGSYANAEQFREGLDRKMDEFGLDSELRDELRGLLEMDRLIEPADRMAKRNLSKLKARYTVYRTMLETQFGSS